MQTNLLGRFCLAVLLSVLATTLLVGKNDDQRFRKRIAAEWEPAIGVIIGWPLVIPEELVVDIAKQEKLFVVLEYESERELAVNKFKELGIADSQVHLVIGDPDETNDEPNVPETHHPDQDDETRGKTDQAKSDYTTEEIYQ